MSWTFRVTRSYAAQHRHQTNDEPAVLSLSLRLVTYPIFYSASPSPARSLRFPVIWWPCRGTNQFAGLIWCLDVTEKPPEQGVCFLSLPPSFWFLSLLCVPLSARPAKTLTAHKQFHRSLITHPLVSLSLITLTPLQQMEWESVIRLLLLCAERNAWSISSTRSAEPPGSLSD